MSRPKKVYRLFLSFVQVNDDDFLYYEFESEEDFEEKFPTIEKWVNKVNQSDEEGVMIKPKTCFIENISPALKVLNNDYLSLTLWYRFSG